MRKHITKSVRFASEQLIFDHIAAALGKGSIEAAGKKFTAGDIEGLVQGRLEATTRVRKARVDYLDAVQAERAALDQTEEDLAEIRQALLVKFSRDAQVLSDLGLAPRKRRKPMTGEAIVKMAAKAKATREGHPAPAPATPPTPTTPPTPITPPAVVNGAGEAAQR